MIIRLLMATGGIEDKNLLEVQWMNAGQEESLWKTRFLTNNVFKIEDRFTEPEGTAKLIYCFGWNVYLLW